MSNDLYLTPRQKRVVQFIATTGNVSLMRHHTGVTRQDIKKMLEITDNRDLEAFLKISNLVLKEETIPAQIIYDDILNRYVYVQTVDPVVLLDRIPVKPLLLFLFMYYQQRGLSHPHTKLIDLLEIVDSSVVENPRQKVLASLKPLVDYNLVKEEGELYRVTKIGDTFMTPLLLKKMTDVTLNKNYDLDVILEFYRKVIPRPEELGTEVTDYQLSLF